MYKVVITALKADTHLINPQKAAGEVNSERCTKLALKGSTDLTAFQAI